MPNSQLRASAFTATLKRSRAAESGSQPVRRRGTGGVPVAGAGGEGGREASAHQLPAKGLRGAALCRRRVLGSGVQATVAQPLCACTAGGGEPLPRRSGAARPPAAGLAVLPSHESLPIALLAAAACASAGGAGAAVAAGGAWGGVPRAAGVEPPGGVAIASTAASTSERVGEGGCRAPAPAPAVGDAAAGPNKGQAAIVRAAAWGRGAPVASLPAVLPPLLPAPAATVVKMAKNEPGAPSAQLRVRRSAKGDGAGCRRPGSVRAEDIDCCRLLLWLMGKQGELPLHVDPVSMDAMGSEDELGEGMDPARGEECSEAG